MKHVLILLFVLSAISGFSQNLTVNGSIIQNDPTYTGNLQIIRNGNNAVGFYIYGAGAIGQWLQVGPNNIVDFMGQAIQNNSPFTSSINNIKFPTNGTPSTGKVATGTDALGNWTWQTPSGGGGTSGTYTSTLTNTTNISSSTFLNCVYTKVGSVVTATYDLQITPISCGASTVLTFTLPFTTSALSGNIGTASIAVNGGTTQYVTGQVRRLNSTQAQLFFISGTGGGCTSTSVVSFTIQYIP
jgi:hypothetical protein